MENEDNNIFYNYVYLDPRKPGSYNYGEFHFDYEPFYIGKGKDNRMYEHLFETEELTYNKKKYNKIQKIRKVTGKDPIIFKILEDLDERVALDNEEKLIATIGRHDKGLGPLTNLTDGGEGIVGYIHTTEDNEKNILTRIIRIYQYDFELNLITIWRSISDASRFFNIKDSNIIKCLKGELSTCNGFFWSYTEIIDDKELIINKLKNVRGIRKFITQYDKNHSFIKIHNSIRSASRDTGINFHLITACCKESINDDGSYIWKYSNYLDIKNHININK